MFPDEVRQIECAQMFDFRELIQSYIPGMVCIYVIRDSADSFHDHRIVVPEIYDVGSFKRK